MPTRVATHDVLVLLLGECVRDEFGEQLSTVWGIACAEAKDEVHCLAINQCLRRRLQRITCLSAPGQKPSTSFQALIMYDWGISGEKLKAKVLLAFHGRQNTHDVRSEAPGQKRCDGGQRGEKSSHYVNPRLASSMP